MTTGERFSVGQPIKWSPPGVYLSFHGTVIDIADGDRYVIHIEYQPSSATIKQLYTIDGVTPQTASRDTARAFRVLTPNEWVVPASQLSSKT